MYLNFFRNLRSENFVTQSSATATPEDCKYLIIHRRRRGERCWAHHDELIDGAGCDTNRDQDWLLYQNESPT